MKIYDEIIRARGIDFIFAAKEADAAETARIIAAYQEMWDNGHTFDRSKGLAAYMCDEREADTPEEIAACVAEASRALTDVVCKAWLTALSREQVVDICKSLFSLNSQLPVKLVVATETLTLDDIAYKWSELHPDSKPVRVPSPVDGDIANM